MELSHHSPCNLHPFCLGCCPLVEVISVPWTDPQYVKHHILKVCTALVSRLTIALFHQIMKGLITLSSFFSSFFPLLSFACFASGSHDQLTPHLASCFSALSLSGSIDLPAGDTPLTCASPLSLAHTHQTDINTSQDVLNV